MHTHEKLAETRPACGPSDKKHRRLRIDMIRPLHLHFAVFLLLLLFAIILLHIDIRYQTHDAWKRQKLAPTTGGPTFPIRFNPIHFDEVHSNESRSTIEPIALDQHAGVVVIVVVVVLVEDAVVVVVVVVGTVVGMVVAMVVGLAVGMPVCMVIRLPVCMVVGMVVGMVMVAAVVVVVVMVAVMVVGFQPWLP